MDVDQRSDHGEMPSFDHLLLMINMKEIGAQTVSATGINSSFMEIELPSYHLLYFMDYHNSPGLMGIPASQPVI